jgi:hypothetical protein
MLTPIQMIIIGFVLILLGALLPFLMVLDVFKSTFFLNFFAYGCQVIGVFIGLMGIFTYAKIKRNIK